MVGVELRTGTRGVFEISLDGETLFSKRSMGRLPEAGEVARLAESRLGPALHWRRSQRTPA